MGQKGEKQPQVDIYSYSGVMELLPKSSELPTRPLVYDP